MSILSKYKYQLAIVALAFIQFANTLDHEYAWDDKIVILENPNVKKGVQGIPAFFVKSHSDYIHDRYGYRPIVQATFALEYQFFGLNPNVGHWVNVLLFCALCILIYFVLVRLFFPDDPWIAFLIMLVFITHPLHTEVVANIKSRDEILQLGFSLLTLFQFDRYYQRKKIKHLFLMILFFFLAYLSRENAITILGVLPFYLLMKSDGNWKRKLRFLLPVPVLAGLAFLIFWLAFRSEVGMDQTSGLDIFYEHPSMGNSFALLTDIGSRFANALVLIFHYFKKFIWPFDLVHYSGYNQIPVTNKFLWVYPICLLGHLLVVTWTLLNRRRQSNLAFGIVFFYVSLSPFTHIFYIMPDTMADRYMFGPSLGLAMVLVCSLRFIIFNNWIVKEAQQKRRMLSAVVAGLVIVGFITTWQRNEVWKNDWTLISSDIDKLENCSKSQEQYADQLFIKYKKNGDRTLIPKIIARYRRSIDITEHAFYARIKLGSNYADLGDAQKGIELLEQTAQLYPYLSDPHFYLANAYIKEKNYEPAIPLLIRSKTLSPKNEDSYYLLAICYLESKQLNDAKLACEDALTRFPKSILLHDAYSDVLFELGEIDRAFKEIQSILEIDPRNEIFHKKLIGRLQQVGRHQDAAKAYEHALSLGLEMNN
jgi:Flp pilus assembly protein TadD